MTEYDEVEHILREKADRLLKNRKRISNVESNKWKKKFMDLHKIR